MFRELLRDIKDYVLGVIKSREFVLVVAFILMAAVLIWRLFVLQIVNGEEYLDSFTLKIKKERSIPSTRGNIYDRNGNLLASNELAYSVTIEDNGTYEDTETKNEELNDTIFQVIRIVEEHGDKINNDFSIVLDDYGNYQFSVEDRQLLRFKADVYGRTKIDDLKTKEKNATADTIMNYLCGEKRYQISGDYSKEEILKIVGIRFAMSSNSYQKYLATPIAADVSAETVAVIMENSDKLQGVQIEENFLRKYEDSKYFAHITGYTGKASQDELDELQKVNKNYALNDIIGKAGIEQYMETELQGKKGSETVYVDNMGKVIEISNRTEPTAGNDLYLTIDKDLQIAVYDIIEQKLAGILISKIRNIKSYTPSENSSASDIVIPIDDVYYALIQHKVIDTSHFSSDDAKDMERQVYGEFQSKQESVLSDIRSELTSGKGKAYRDLPREMQSYMSYIVNNLLMDSGRNVLMRSEIDKNDETYIAWTKSETISLKEYLEYAISMSWIDISQISVDSQYLDSEEIYAALVEYIIESLKEEENFSSLIYKYMIAGNTLSGREVCMLLYEQGILPQEDEDRAALESGKLSAYQFMMNKITNLQITPGQLGLDPCSGSAIVTDTRTGQVLACVSYPGYDNNRLANTMDADYYRLLSQDTGSKPLYNKATQETTAPGSTFKIVSSVAGLSEGVITVNQTIQDLGIYDKITPSPRCWIYSRSHGTHGQENVVTAIRDSCNYFFYDVGYQLGLDSGKYVSDKGIQRLSKYAEMFGMGEPSGIEIAESESHISDEDAVRSAIGQGTNIYTTSQLNRYAMTIANSGSCYELTLLKKLESSDGATQQEFGIKEGRTLEISNTIWNAVHEGMKEVVNKTSAFDNLGIQAAGKTGTAQQITTRPDHALFIGYAPYDNPEIAIATRIAHGYTSANAVEVTRDILKYYFKLVDASEILSGKATQTQTVTGD